MYDITHVVAQHSVLNSVPKGSGFLKTNEIFGSPPVAVVLGLQALIVSSRTFLYDVMIRVYKDK